ncbi:DUF92 domain-containing protein [Acidicapsa dinghuensis]|uniref:DUF92 domain-containing protein n=1 Tax=Acidicapsa dinghuensis TaxID=2218256 RepID=A0ABW1EKN8_9BACT|nr:DUF92 domain-containing protein [Acidicapsa dinghuensis]
MAWQSKAILLLVLPWTSLNVLFAAYWWAPRQPVVLWTTLGISGSFGLLVWLLRAGTAGASATGAIITTSLMFSTARFPYAWSWLHGALLPVLAVFLLAFTATKIGKSQKERLGTAENKRGRNAAQVAANLGIAALAATASLSFNRFAENAAYLNLVLAIAALAEATADTVSSEIGQVFGGQPRSITTFRLVPPGTDGGITLVGTFSGIIAAAIVAAVAVWGTGTWSFHSQDAWLVFGMSSSGGIGGLLFDSVLGDLIERRGWLNNDAVNFSSTLAAVGFSLLFWLLWMLAHPMD